MARLRLVHWKAAEAKERARRLREGGHEVVAGPLDASGLRRLRQRPPDAVLIDLGRIPSQGRDVGVALRSSPATRHVPLVFVEGSREKVAAVKAHLPDAAFTTWGRIRRDLQKALRSPPANPTVPKSNLAGYSGTPLPKKLGIAPGMKVALVGAPRGFVDGLGEIPDGVRFVEHAARCDLLLWFVKTRDELRRRIGRMGDLFERGGLWICWPKRTSGVSTDLGEPTVREVGLSSGLVDYKTCAVDATWSGLKFARRKAR